jgi:hypothetical protein
MRAILIVCFVAMTAMAETTQIRVVTSEGALTGGGIYSSTSVSTHVILTDGAHVSLWCSNWARRCWRLNPGTYKADVNFDKGVVWVYAKKNGKTQRIKYRVSGNW